MCAQVTTVGIPTQVFRPGVLVPQVIELTHLFQSHPNHPTHQCSYQMGRRTLTLVPPQPYVISVATACSHPLRGATPVENLYNLRAMTLAFTLSSCICRWCIRALQSGPACMTAT